MIIEGEVEQEALKAVCMNVLSGDNIGVNTILVRGTIKNMKLTMLIDSRNTHSFIDVNTAKELEKPGSLPVSLRPYMYNYH